MNRTRWRDATSYFRLSRSYRRDILNSWLQKWHDQVRGIVLDVGGEKGSKDGFQFAEGAGISRRLYLNIDGAKGPDIVADGTRIPVASATMDTVICLETLEHVLDPCAVLDDLSRVLRSGGVLLLSVPFLFRLHGVPQDFWRFTEYQVIRMVERSGLQTLHLEALGGFPTVICEMVKQTLSDIRCAPIRWALGILFLPVAGIWLGVERLAASPRSVVRRFTTGYAVLAIKPEHAKQSDNASDAGPNRAT